MKYYSLFACGLVMLAQSTTSTFVNDINGRRVQSASVVSTDGTHTEITQSVNGRKVPLEQTEQHVVRQDASGSVIETTVRKFDSDGHLASTVKTVTEEQKRANGSSKHATTYRSDINGRMSEAERSNVETVIQGSQTTTQTVIERPSLNQTFQAVEKRSAVSVKSGNDTHTDETVYKLSENGSYVPALRSVTETKKTGDQTVETTAQYEPVGGETFQLTSQSVATTVTRPDGSESSQVNLFMPSIPGHVGTSKSAAQLYEQQFIERQKGAGGSVTETLSVRRPSPSDPNRLGPATRISETVCNGKCLSK